MEAYLDNSATTQCAPEVAETMMQVLTKDYGNPSSLHQKGVDAEKYLRSARETIAQTLKVLPKEIYFTSGGTEGNNLAIKGAAEANQRAGKHILVSPIEHACVYECMKYLSEHGFEVEYLPVDQDGLVDLKALSNAIRPDTILVSVMQVNNEIGALEPIEQAGRIIKAKNPNCLFHVDAVQSYGKVQIRPKKANIDMLTVSGHKIHGPKGSGFIYIRDKVKVQPLILGGGQERGMRSGTENTAAIAGLGVAAQMAYDHLEENRQHLYALKQHFIERILKIDGCSVNGRTGEDSAPHIVSVSVDGVRAEVLLHALEEKEVYVSAGSACSSNRPSISRTLQAIGLPKNLLDSTVRFSFSVHTTMEEIDWACDCMEQLVPMLKKFYRH